VLVHLSPAQRRALVIADNQLAITGAAQDEELLRIELATLHEEDFNVDLVGFADVELARLPEAQEASTGLTDEDTVPEVQPNRVSRPGDLFILGKHRLICGDCTDPAVCLGCPATLNPSSWFAIRLTGCPSTQSGEIVLA
jgi:hypothetical protein